METLVKSKSLFFSLLCVFLVYITGCTSREKSSGTEDATAGADSSKGVIIERISGYPLPTSFEITTMLNDAGAPYILSLSNASSNAGNYFTQAEKALNLGVYGADLSYASTYRMKQETMLYLNASRQLMDELEISSVFNYTYGERIERNLDNGDSLITIISDSFVDTYNYLTVNNKDKLAILVMAGSWVEGLYITTNLAITARDNKEILDIIAHQKSSLYKLLEIMDPVREDADALAIYEGLTTLLSHFDSISEKVTDKILEAISTTIEEIRNDII